MHKIIFKKLRCIGCGACSSTSDNWIMNYDTGKASPKKTKVEKLGDNKDAKDVCPVYAIKFERI